jgi:hypothetical protein
MARATTPPFGQYYARNPRRVVSVGELERLYGRHAQVELRSSPTNANAAPNAAEPPSYYDPQAYDDPIELPVQRSPWLPLVVVLMLGIGALLGYALYRRGLVPPQLVRQRVVLQESQSLPSTISWQPPPVLPIIGAEDTAALASPTSNAPATAADAKADAPTEPAQVPSAGEAASPARDTAVPTTQPAARARRAAPANRTTEDEAATMDAIRRERARVQESDPAASEDSESNPPKSNSKSSGEAVYPQPTPPGYIEAETPPPP